MGYLTPKVYLGLTIALKLIISSCHNNITITMKTLNQLSYNSIICTEFSKPSLQNYFLQEQHLLSCK
jgi:hypothetical protein